MKRVLVVVVLLAAVGAGAFWYLRTCCAPPPDAPAHTAAARPSDNSRRAASSAPAAAENPRAEAAPRSSTSAPTAKSRAAAPKPSATLPVAAPPAATAASLRIVSDVPGAQVFLNREFVGTAPTTAQDLTPGEYQLNVAAPGYDNHVETLTLAAGEREIVVSFRTVKLDASVDVIHKHRFGSCRGRLVATPAGLRYETTDKDDAFSAGLLELETFQVDYLNKNLRVQVRKGKRYDFTDPQGNADRLFVFHRDVDKVRERLRTDR